MRSASALFATKFLNWYWSGSAPNSNPNSTAKAWLYWVNAPSSLNATIMSMDDSMMLRLRSSASASLNWVALCRSISSFKRWFASSANVARICSRINATLVRKSVKVTCTAGDLSWNDNVMRMPTSTTSLSAVVIRTSRYGGRSPRSTNRMSSCNTAWSSS